MSQIEDRITALLQRSADAVEVQPEAPPDLMSEGTRGSGQGRRGGALVLAAAVVLVAAMGVGLVTWHDRSELRTVGDPNASELAIEPDDVRGRELCGEWLQGEIDDKVANVGSSAQGLGPWKPDWVLVAGYDSMIDDAVAWSEVYLVGILGEDARRDEVTGEGRRLLERSVGLDERYAAVCWIRGTFGTGYLQSTVIVLPNGDHASVVADRYLRDPIRPSIAGPTIG